MSLEDSLAAFADAEEAAPSSSYGMRQDGTAKGDGFYGPLPSKDPRYPRGTVSTELSADMDVDGKNIHFPLLVPGLSRAEIDSLLAGDKPSDAIYDKALSHAQKRIAGGMSPFAGNAERVALPSNSASLESSLSLWADQEEKDSLKASSSIGLQKDTSKSTKILQLFGRTGLPKEFIERNQDFVEQESIKKDFDPDRLMKESPAFAGWLAEHPDHVAAAKNDVSKLSYIERQIRFIGGSEDAGQLMDELVDLGGKAFNDQITPQERKRQAEIEQKLQDIGRANEGLDLDGFSEIPGAVVEQFPNLVRGLKGKIEYAAKGLVAGTAAGAIVGSPGGPPGTAAGAIGGGVAGGLVGLRWGAAVSAGEVERNAAYIDYEKLKDEQGNPLDKTTIKGLALMAGAVNGAVEGLTGMEALIDKLPGVKHLARKGVKELLKTPTARGAILGMAKQVGITSIQEGATEVFQMYVTKTGGELAKWAKDGGSPVEVLGRIFSAENAAQSIQEFKKGVQSSVGTSTVLTTPNLVQDLRQVKRANETKKAFEAVGKVAESAEFAKNLPDSLKTIIERSVSDGPIESLYVPADTFNTYFQGKGVDPRDVYAEITGNPEAYDQAIQTGQPLPIKTADYASKLAGTEHNAFFANELKTDLDAMNAREAAEWMEQQDKILEAQTAQDGAQVQSATDPLVKIQNDISEQLRAAGYNPDAIGPFAEYFAQRYQARAARRGMGEDPAELFKAQNLTIQRELPDVLRKLHSKTSELDALLNRLRTGDAPRAQDIYGPSLADFLREKGGVQDQGGELKARDVDGSRKAFQKKLTRKDGLTLDDAAELAAEAGYLEDRNINALLDALDKDTRGTPVYAQGRENAALLDVQMNLDAMKDFLKARSIDLATTTNEQIKALFTQAAQQSLPMEGQTFTQTPPEPGRKYTFISRAQEYAERDIYGIDRPGILSIEIGDKSRWIVPDSTDGPIIRINNIPGTVDGNAAASQGSAFFDKQGALVKISNSGQPGFVPDQNALDAAQTKARHLASRGLEQYQKVVYIRYGDLPKAGHSTDYSTGKKEKGISVYEAELDPATDHIAFKGDALPAAIIQKTATGVPSYLVTGKRVGTGADGEPVLKNVQIVKRLTPQDFGIQIPNPSSQQQGGPLYQGDDTPKGSITFGDQQSIINLFNGADLSTAIHESGHLWLNELIDDATIQSSNQYGSFFHGTTTEASQAIEREGFKVAGGTDLTGPAVFFGKEGDKSWAETATAFSEGPILERRIDKTQLADFTQSGFQYDSPEVADAIQQAKKAGKKGALFPTETVIWDTSVIETGKEQPDRNQLTDDLDTILKWMGLDVTSASGKDAIKAAIQTKHHEQFARGFEAYAMEGKSPSTALREVFAKFRNWLIQVYRTLTTKPLQVKLNDDVRAVMDRMVATDDQIDQAAAEADVVPMFTDAESAGMTPKQFDAYKETVANASTKARETLQAKLMKQLAREKEEWWKTERAAMEQTVTAEVNDQNEYIALAVLQTGKMPDGSEIPNGIEAMKLNRKAMEEIFGKDFIKTLPKGMTDKDGMHPDVAAPIFGYQTGQELVMAVANARPKDKLIQAETNRRMREAHGDLLTDGTIAEEAKTAVLNELQEKVVHAELKALNAKRRDVAKFVKAAQDETKAAAKAGRDLLATMTPTLEQVRETARKIIARTALKNVNANQYSIIARQASRKATKAAAKDDWVNAGHFKQQELLNLALFRDALLLQEQIEKTKDLAKRYHKTDEKLAKSRNVDLVNVGRAILAQYGLGPDTDKTAAQYLEAIQTYDEDLYKQWKPVVDEIAPRPLPYTALTVDEFVRLSSDLDSLWTLSRRVQQTKIDGQMVDRQDIIDQLNARLDTLTPQEKKQVLGDLSASEDAKVGLMSWVSALRRVESWVDAMDGGDHGGVFRKYIWNPISDAAVTFRSEKATVMQRYMELMKPIDKTMTHEMIPAPELGQGYQFRGKPALLHAILHTGNASNLDKLIRGYGWTADQWTAFVDRAQRDGTLTKADYDYAQGVWDLLDSIKPEAQKAHHDMYGYYFNEITASPIQTQWGEYKGGYVPAIADAAKSVDQAIRQEKDLFDQAGNSFMFPTTGRGFTKGRVEKYAAPLALNLRTIPIHLDKVMRFVHLEPRVKDAARLVTNKAFRNSLDAYDATAAKDMLVPWLQRAAQQTVSTPGKNRHADRLFRYLRNSVGSQIMVANVVNTLQQFTGFSLSLTKVKAKHLRHGLYRYLSGPGSMAEDIHAKSKFMAQRTTTQVMEIQATIDDITLNPTKYEKAVNFSKRHGYFMQQGTQNIVDLITWSGAYDQAVMKGETEQDAVRQADSAVRETQGSFDPESISAFEAGTPFTRAFTMFYSYFNMQANLLGTEFQKVARDMGVRKGAGRAFYLYFVGFMIPAVLAEIIVKASGGFDADDEDEYLNEALSVYFMSQIRTSFAMVPGVGPMALAGVNMLNNKWYDDRIATSPVVSMLESAVRAPISVYEAMAEDKHSKRAVKDFLTLLGLTTGLPASALGRPLGYMADVYDGVAKPEDAVDVGRGLLSGKDVNRKQ
jgi:hypothetical protein